MKPLALGKKKKNQFHSSIEKLCLQEFFELFGEPSLFQIATSYAQFPVLIPLICSSSDYYSTKAP
jgi:hypothetical protein